mmetsp:Transcript_398/g.899  ORF Transcript_398/g.899 Transcript_398/m.899 type:complete len:95 (+) Transcript_398:1390-1674(+)
MEEEACGMNTTFLMTKMRVKKTRTTRKTRKKQQQKEVPRKKISRQKRLQPPNKTSLGNDSLQSHERCQKLIVHSIHSDDDDVRSHKLKQNFFIV